MITDALQKAIKGGGKLTITFIATTPAAKSEIEGRYLLEFTGLQIAAFE